jgi:hypothetical protein
MSATATPHQVRQPFTRATRIVSAALIGVALTTLTWVAMMTVVRDNSPAIDFDPSAAQRIHLVREHGSAASYDASGALQAHLRRENNAAPAGILFDHVLRENDSN